MLHGRNKVVSSPGTFDLRSNGIDNLERIAEVPLGRLVIICDISTVTLEKVLVGDGFVCSVALDLLVNGIVLKVLHLDQDAFDTASGKLGANVTSQL